MTVNNNNSIKTNDHYNIQPVVSHFPSRSDPPRSPIYIISILFISNTHSHDAIYLHTVYEDD